MKSSWAVFAASIFVVSCWVGLPNPAEAQASFDCRRASHPSEIAICQDPGLAGSDRNLDATYRAALERSENPEALWAEQRRWLRDLRLCREDPFCLYESYADRIAALKTGPSAADTGSVPTEEPSSDRVSEAALPVEGELSPGQETVTAAHPVMASAESRSESRTTSPNAVERKDRKQPARPKGVSQLLGGGLILGLIVTVLAALLVTKALADHSMRRFGWPMILNWWNALHLVSGFALWCGAASGAPLGGVIVAGGLWLIVMAVNIRKTDLVTGVAMTIVQPFVVAILFVVVQLSRSKPQPYSFINRS